MPVTQSQDSSFIVPIWINGQAVPVDQSHLIPVYSAAQKSTVYTAQSATPSLALSAADAAWRAFLSWKNTTYVERRDILLYAADIYERRADDLIKFQEEETSCSKAYAKFNIRLACKCLREIAADISTACTGELPPTESPGSIVLVTKEPVGPVLAIAPWNSALILATRAIASPIGAGCTVVFKASELCPRTHHAIVEIFNEAGLPAGCLNQLQTRREDAAAVTEALISHQAIRKIEFIGSAAVGKIIGQVASKYLKPVLMELGGKAPAIILKDADLRKAAQLSAMGAFLHHGQICMSTDRLIVVREVVEEFTKILKGEMESNWAKGAGYAVSRGIADHAHSLLEDAEKNGATYLVGANNFIGDTGASLQPTIITNVKAGDKVYAEETFGPSAALYVVESEEAAIKLANDTPYGLNAAVHSTDVFAALRVARQLDFGQVHINTMTEYDEANAPIGGVKGSGWGRNNGKYGLREFLVEKIISIHDAASIVNFG
jgi:acyl-CoA reductase-like NAD-dependent aldehyde dehydrogenase